MRSSRCSRSTCCAKMRQALLLGSCALQRAGACMHPREWPPTLLTKSCKAWLQGAQSAAHETHHGLAGGQQVLLCHDDLAGLGGQERDTNSALRNSWQTAARWSSASACFGHALPSRWGCWAGECTMAAIHTNGPG